MQRLNKPQPQTQAMVRRPKEEQPMVRKTTHPQKEAVVTEQMCHWPCPCGGTVPNTPDHCVFSKRSPKGHTDCADASACLTMCGDIEDCDAYKKFKLAVKERHLQDVYKRERRNGEKE